MRNGGLRALAGVGLVLVLIGGLSPAAALADDRSGLVPAIDLGALPGSASSEAVDINDDGTVVGRSRGHAVSWDSSGRITDLGALPGGSYSHAVAINDDGVTVGQSTAADARYHLVLWDSDGRITDLDTLPGGTYFNPTAITSDGTVFGYGDTPDSRTQHARWERRTGFTLLAPMPDAYACWASAVNDRGIAIGFCYGPGLYGHMVRWDRAGHPTDLGTLDHLWSRPVDINDSGTVVGETWPGIGPEFTPMRWTHGHGFTELRTPYRNGHALAVNRGGIAVGSWTGPHGDAPARWDRDGALLTLRMPYGVALGSAYEINDQGTTVGVVEWYDDVSHFRRAVRWDPEGYVTDLGTLGGPQAWPTALNEHGTTVGNAVSPDGQVRAVLWPANSTDH